MPRKIIRARNGYIKEVYDNEAYFDDDERYEDALNREEALRALPYAEHDRQLSSDDYRYLD